MMSIITKIIHKISNLSLSFERFGTVFAERERERELYNTLNIYTCARNIFFRILYIAGVLFPKNTLAFLFSNIIINCGGMPMT